MTNSGQPQFMSSHGVNRSVSGGPTAPLIDDIENNQIVVSEKKSWKNLFSYMGPGFLVAIAYIDPGNFETDLQAGAQHKYKLLWIILVASCAALVIQSLAAKLGVVTGKHLAEHCRAEYSRVPNFILWVLAEIAVIACDIPEVIGTAFALNMLFKIPVWCGVLITGFSTLVFLLLQQYGVRKLEFLIAFLVFTMAACFFGELTYAKPNASEVIEGLFIPQLKGNGATGLAISLLGAMVMPHNLFLHSALVLSRKVPRSVLGIKEACRFYTIESAFALTVAFLINISVISVSGAICSSPDLDPEDQMSCKDLDLNEASFLLKHVLGNWSSKLFAIALLASGQSSTITGTYAGQYVMQAASGYQNRVATCHANDEDARYSEIERHISGHWNGEPDCQYEKLMLKQQKIFVQQVFELHRLIKVQKLIASSPDVLIKGHSYLSSPPKVPTKSRSPEHRVKLDLQIVEQKDDSQQPNKKTKSPKENTVGATPLPSCEEVFSKELSGQGPRNGTYSENLRNEAYPGNPPVVPLTTNNKASPWCFHPPPNQWLVPVMSPSEGLVYKPYKGSCPPTSGFVAPVYGSCTPLAGDFMHTGYGVPTSHQQQNMNMGSFPGTPAISPSYFRTPAVRPVVNPITSASAVEQVIPLVRPQLHGHAEQHSRSSCNMSNPKREAFSGYARMFQASKDSELQGSTGSSPCDKGREGRDALPLFPTAPTGEGSTQPSASCEKDNQARVIKVVPRNARSATESAAMIFRSIQEERRQCGS